MCATTERNTMVCGHRTSFITICKKESPTSLINKLRKCSPVLNSTYHFDTCHDCRHFWHNAGIGEKEAIDRTRAYRRDHNYHAPLSPATVLSHTGRGSTDAGVVKFRTEENSSTETLWPSRADPQRGTASKPLPREPGKARRIEKRKTVDKGKRPLTLGAESYPELLPQTLPQARYPPGTAESNCSGLETIIIGMESDAQDFGLRNIDRPLPLKVNKEGFKRQNSKSRTSQPKPRLDLDKPLPRPPRCDSPMPGRPFDNQNPERDLPAKMYYPRFI